MRIPLLTISLFAAIAVNAQTIAGEERSIIGKDDQSFLPMVRVEKTLHEGDSIPYIEFNNVYIYPEQEFKSAKQQKQYNTLVRNVKKVLPIAKEAHAMLIETYEYIQTLPDQKAREEHLKYVEKSVLREYTPRMKKLTYSQGKLLIKLIHRECSSSGYQLIQAFLGPVRAGIYQAFAWTFGASLKKEYDAEGIDRVTERVVRQVEAGQL